MNFNVSLKRVVDDSYDIEIGYKLCDKLYVTKIDAVLDADTFIANFDEDPDFEIESESEPITENGLTFKFVVYKKK